MRDSILMTVYNRPHLVLMKTLESLAKNDLRDTEVVVVDDGSTADYSSVWDLFAPIGLKVVRVDTVKDRPDTYHLDGYNNPSHAWNQAFRASSGENVFVLSSDTMIPPHAMTEARKRRLTKIVYCGMVVDLDTAMEYLGLRRLCPFGWFMGTARENFAAIADGKGNVWDEEYLRGFAFEDNDFSARLCLQAGRVVVDLSVCCWHQSHPPTAYTDEMKGWKANESYTLKKWDGIPWSHHDWHTGHKDPINPKKVTNLPDSIQCDLSEVKVHAAV